MQEPHSAFYYSSTNQPRAGTIDKLNRVLQVTIYHVFYPITEEELHQVFSPCGFVGRIKIFRKSTCVQAFVHFQFHQSAILAKSSLQGQNIYDDCCQLDIQYRQNEHYAPQLKQQELMDECLVCLKDCRSIFSKYFKQGNDLFEKENSDKVHIAIETLDTSQPTLEVYGPSGLDLTVQGVNHSTSHVVQNHEIMNMVVTKPIQLDEKLYKGFIDIPMGSTITHFLISMMNGSWVDETDALTRNKLWYFLVRWLQPV
ncbi:hypothetical protein Ddye_026483 [Dipteronia dyeriana]|uniref:RRM domain-containing protein n=1 Tax=Dipteronia dyeriana TaxID=168575 RepID=A0AAD9WQI5_9ROSI|nr:hypothetical protein Ddye_026483 [Dipteronia dyeriana]